MCPGSVSGSPPRWTFLEHLPGNASRREPCWIPKPPKLALSYAKEQRLYLKLLSLFGWAQSLWGENSFQLLVCAVSPFWSWPHLLTISEGWKVDTTGEPCLHFPLRVEQLHHCGSCPNSPIYPFSKIFELLHLWRDSNLCVSCDLAQH